MVLSNYPFVCAGGYGDIFWGARDNYRLLACKSMFSALPLLKYTKVFCDAVLENSDIGFAAPSGSAQNSLIVLCALI
jgi:hypothetical protein